MISQELEHGILSQARALEKQFITTAQTAVEFVVDVRESLDAIRDNTKKLFFWTFTIVVIFLGLFMIDQLVKLQRQLVQLNDYQLKFHEMWVEDKEEERRLRLPEARDILVKELMNRPELQVNNLPFTLEDIDAALEKSPSIGSRKWRKFVVKTALDIRAKYNPDPSPYG